MRQNKVDTMERQIEREFMRMGSELAKPVHEEIRARMRALAPKFGLTGLVMGNGHYVLEGEFAVTYGDGSKGTLPASELLDFDEGKVWSPDGLKKRSRAKLIELREFLDYLTDAPYLPPLDLKESDLR